MRVTDRYHKLLTDAKVTMVLCVGLKCGYNASVPSVIANIPNEVDLIKLGMEGFVVKGILPSDVVYTPSKPKPP
jgi:hypothetical protein